MKEFYEYLDNSETKLFKHGIESLIDNYIDIVEIEEELKQYADYSITEQATTYFNDIQNLAKVRRQYLNEFEACFQMLADMYQFDVVSRVSYRIKKYIEVEAWNKYKKFAKKDSVRIS